MRRATSVAHVPDAEAVTDQARRVELHLDPAVRAAEDHDFRHAGHAQQPRAQLVVGDRVQFGDRNGVGVQPGGKHGVRRGSQRQQRGRGDAGGQAGRRSARRSARAGRSRAGSEDARRVAVTIDRPATDVERRLSTPGAPCRASSTGRVTRRSTCSGERPPPLSARWPGAGRSRGKRRSRRGPGHVGRAAWRPPRARARGPDGSGTSE